MSLHKAGEWIGTRYLVAAAACFALSWTSTPPTYGESFSQTGSPRPAYSREEYDDFNAANLEQDPSKKIVLLDDFTRKHPQSVLFIYIYPMYYRVYEQWKDFPKVIEYADKLVALGERVDAASRYAALYASTVAYNSMHSDDPKLAEDARGRALAAVALQSALKRPPMLDERAFADEKNRAAIYLHATAGIAALIAKDYAAATESFTAVMGLSKPHIRTTTTPK